VPTFHDGPDSNVVSATARRPIRQERASFMLGPTLDTSAQAPSRALGHKGMGDIGVWDRNGESVGEWRNRRLSPNSKAFQNYPIFGSFGDASTFRPSPTTLSGRPTSEYDDAMDNYAVDKCE